LDVLQRPDDSATHQGAEIASPHSVVRRWARGGWFVVLYLAVLALSSLPAPQPVPSGSPSIRSSSVDFVAITRAAGLYDLTRAAKVVQEWRSDKQKHRLPRHGDAANLTAATPEIEARRSGAESRAPSAVAALRPFRAFDAQAPPSTC
jgi:hypothetical protein